MAHDGHASSGRDQTPLGRSTPNRRLGCHEQRDRGEVR
jgi:hypothetical protein